MDAADAALSLLVFSLRRTLGAYKPQYPTLGMQGVAPVRTTLLRNALQKLHRQPRYRDPIFRRYAMHLHAATNNHNPGL